MVLLSLFALRGYFKGLFRETFSLAGLIVGFMVAVRYDEPVAALWTHYWKSSFILLRAVTFVGLFFIIYITFGLAGWLLHRAAKVLLIQTVNRMGGILMGAGKGAAVLALIIFLLASFPLMPPKAKQRLDQSYLAPPLHQFAEFLIRIGKANLLPADDSEAQERAARGSS